MGFLSKESKKNDSVAKNLHFFNGISLLSSFHFTFSTKDTFILSVLGEPSFRNSKGSTKFRQPMRTVDRG